MTIVASTFTTDDEFVSSYRSSVNCLVRDWAPRAAEWERDRSLPREVFSELADAGLFRRRWEHGVRPGFRLAVAMAEELSEVSAGLALAVSLHSEVFTGLLISTGLSQQAELAISGDMIGCLASTEPQGGSDLGSLATTAIEHGSGWRVTGRKMFTSNIAAATHAIVLARVHGSGHAAPFLVDLGRCETTSLETFGVRSCPTGQLHLADVPALPLGRPGMSFLHVQRTLQRERLLGAAQALVGARLALRLAAAFARSRCHRGFPLIQNDHWRQKLGALSAHLAAAESLLEAAIEQHARGASITRSSSAAKLVAAQLANEVVDACMQLLGGRGYLESFPVAQLLRDTRLARVGGGSDEVLRELLASGLERPDPTFDDWLTKVEEDHWNR